MSVKTNPHSRKRSVEFQPTAAELVKEVKFEKVLSDLRMALEAADMVTWEWDIPTRSVRYSENIGAIVRGANVKPYCSLDTLIPEIHPDDRERLARVLEETSEKGTPFECEYRVRMLDGTYRWILGRGRRVVVEGGKPVRVLGISMDITERRRTEEALRASEEEDRAAFEQAAVGITHVGTDGRFLRVNDKLCTILGYQRDELLKMTFQEISHPDDLEADLNHVRQVLSGEIKTYSMEKRYIRKDRSTVWANLTVSLVRSDAGEARHFISVVEDITERKRASEVLRESEERFRALAERVLVGIYILLDSKYVYINPAMARIFGYSVSEMTGMTPSEIVQPSDQEKVGDHIRRRIAGEMPSARDEVRGRHRDGSTVDVEVWCSRVEIDGKPALVGTVVDITRRKRAETETQRLRQELARFSRVATVNELTASIAHELNQPLAAILSNAQAALRFMQSGAPDLKELREILDDIVADDRRAAEVIRSMRSMLKSGVNEHHPLSLNNLITEVMPIVRNDAMIRRISVVLDLGSPMSLVEGNRIHLQQVILNLVVNAFEAMEASKESREVMLRTRQEAGEIVLEVRDSGPGIPADKLNSIFDPFFTTKTTGLGMGLSLSHSIVTAHHGRLWAENNPERGATFHMVLPASSNQTVGNERTI